MSIHTLSTIQLPADKGYRRDTPKRTVVKTDTFWDRYDTQTLIYDCYHDEKRQTLTLLLPRSFNFGPQLKKATFLADGSALPKPRWRKWRHHETLTFRGVASAQTLEIQIDGLTLSAPIHPVDDGLDGLNAIYTISLDNDLAWIKDWAHFHVQHHNLQAVVFFDNGSKDYTLQDIDDTLKSVPGIQAVRVVQADLPFGPLDEDCTYRTDAKFMQVAMLNLARNRFMSRSRAMLNLDVDELLVSPTRENVFDATVNDFWGHLTFPGTWHYPDDDTTDVTHATHQRIRANDKPCPGKFSLNPSGIFGAYSLQVHCLERFNRKFRFAPARFWFIHCHGISTSWKYARTSPKGDFLAATDTALQALNAGFQK